VPDGHYLKSIIGKDWHPIIIKVINIKAALLKTEKGEDISNEIDLMIHLQKVSEYSPTDVIWQQRNFILSGSVLLPNFEVEFLKFL